METKGDLGGGTSKAFGLLDLRLLAETIIEKLLEGTHLAEASIHRSKNSRIWCATFTGPDGGPVWRSTGLADRTEALVLARRWEAEARAQRGRQRPKAQRPVERDRPGGSATGNRRLTQQEVALLLGMSERGVRAAERRALQKLRNHPALQQVWRRFLAGELDESEAALALVEN